MAPVTERELAARLAEVQERIGEAARRAGRRPQEVRLMAVTKTFPRPAVEAAVKTGLRLFGENRVQEAAAKYRDLQPQVELHLIGHLQRNKARLASGTFTCVQSIDKLETALALDRGCREAGRRMDVLLEVNTSAEAGKFGVHRPEELFALLDGILEESLLNVRGLMTVGPLTADAGQIRRSFGTLRELYQTAIRRYPQLSLDTLSMGMSGDFEIAVEEGSTLVRIGTALFGARAPDAGASADEGMRR
jgi:hypothetical protein